MKKLLSIAKHITKLARSRSIMTQGKENTYRQIGRFKDYSCVADYIMDMCDRVSTNEDQNWVEETTTWTFRDGSYLVMNSNCRVTVFEGE